MGEEFFAKGANVQLGPGLCVARVPQDGRNFEYVARKHSFLSQLLSDFAPFELLQYSNALPLLVLTGTSLALSALLARAATQHWAAAIAPNCLTLAKH